MNAMLAIYISFAATTGAEGTEATEVHTGFIGLQVLAILLLVALKGLFVAAEFSLVKVRASQIDEILSEGSTRAAIKARSMVSRLDEFVGATQFGITLTSIALSMLGE